MVGSAVARPVRILVGGLDFSECFVSYSGARSTADTSGLLSITGQIELQYIAGKTPESLDDRLNPHRWYRGQRVTLDIGNEAGGWDRFPHGALRIIEAEFDGRGRLKLKVGDLIAYGSFKEATDYRDAGIEPPASTLASTIAGRLLAKMGMPGLIGSFGNLDINYPINIGDNYWATIGQLAFSGGRYVYVDRFEVIRTVRMRSHPGAAELLLNVGNDEMDYGRLTGAQKPPAKIVVTGTRKIVTEYTPYTVSVSEEYGPSFLLGGTTSSYPVLLSRTTIVDDWQPEDDRRRITTTRLEPIGAVNPEAESSRRALIRSLVQEEDSLYEEEGNGDEDKAKLLRIESESRAPRIIAIAPYREGWETYPYVLEDFQKKLTRFSYTPDEQTTESRQETLWETAANLVPSEDWSDSAFNPYFLHPGEATLVEWSETIPELEWEEATTTRKALEKASEQGQNVPPDLPIEAKLSLITTGRDRRTSNNGVRPPAPDRRPPKYTVVEKPFRHEVNLPQKGGSYRQRSITLNIPFLPGEVGSSVSLRRRRRVYSFNALAWQKYLGKLFGVLLIGRHKGSEISLPYRDALTVLKPLSVVDVTEPLFEGGTVTRSFLVDGDAYALTPTENRCGFDLIWMGDRTGVTTTITTINPDGTETSEDVELTNPPYVQPLELLSYGAGVGVWSARPYGLQGPVNDFSSYGAGVSGWAIILENAQMCWDTLTGTQWDTLTGVQWDSLMGAQWDALSNGCVNSTVLVWDDLSDAQWDSLTNQEWDDLQT